MIIPVVAGFILLGGAFDFYRIAPTKHQVIDEIEIKDNLQVIPKICSENHYRIVKSASDVNRALKLDPFVSLKAKNGDAKVVGLDTYLRDVVDRNNTVEIVLVVDYETETLSFPPGLRKSDKWQSKPQSEVGTHYISSVKFGGSLVASVVIKPLKAKYLTTVQKAVESKIPKSGSIDELFFGDLESVVQSVHKKAQISINVATTTGHTFTPANLEELAKTVEEYPEIVKSIHGGKGRRLRIELEDIHRVQANYSRFEVNRELEVLIEEANEKFEDLRIAEKVYKDWRNTNPIMKETEESLLKEFWEQLQAAKESLSAAISNLHYDGESNQLDEAFSVYNQLQVDEPYRYTYVLEKTIQTINDKSFWGKLYYWFIKFLKSILKR